MNIYSTTSPNKNRVGSNQMVQQQKSKPNDDDDSQYAHHRGIPQSVIQRRKLTKNIHAANGSKQSSIHFRIPFFARFWRIFEFFWTDNSKVQIIGSNGRYLMENALLATFKSSTRTKDTRTTTTVFMSQFQQVVGWSLHCFSSSSQQLTYLRSQFEICF